MDSCKKDKEIGLQNPQAPCNLTNAKSFALESAAEPGNVGGILYSMYFVAQDSFLCFYILICRLTNINLSIHRELWWQNDRAEMYELLIDGKSDQILGLPPGHSYRCLRIVAVQDECPSFTKDYDAAFIFTSYLVSLL